MIPFAKHMYKYLVFNIHILFAPSMVQCGENEQKMSDEKRPLLH